MERPKNIVFSVKRPPIGPYVTKMQNKREKSQIVLNERARELSEENENIPSTSKRNQLIRNR